MSQSDFVLNAEAREKVGKASARSVRSLKKLPAVVYGPEIKDNIYILIDYKEFEKAFKAFGRHHPLTISVGKKKLSVIVKDYRIHPISRDFLHVDFYAYAPKKPFTTEVPLNYLGTPVGVKEGGGLYVFARKLKINTDIENLPAAVDVDISQLKINQYLIVRDIQKGNYKILTHEGTALVEIK
jgi:large subunit ribosomal protein L25